MREESIHKLEREISSLKSERNVLMDTISLKSLGFQMYGTLKHLPSKDEEEAEPAFYSPEKDSAEPIIVKRDQDDAPPSTMRQIVRKREAENLDMAAREARENARLMELARAEAARAAVETLVREAKSAA